MRPERLQKIRSVPAPHDAVAVKGLHGRREVAEIGPRHRLDSRVHGKLRDADIDRRDRDLPQTDDAQRAAAAAV